MTSAPPVDISQTVTRFATGCDINYLAGKFHADRSAREQLMLKLAYQPHLINELPLAETDKDKIKLYTPPPTMLGTASGYPRALPPHQIANNGQAEGVIFFNCAAIGQFARDMATTAARSIRGHARFSEVFLSQYAACRLEDETFRGNVIRAGHPDVDYQPTPNVRSARTIASTRMHKNITQLPPPAPSTPVRTPRARELWKFNI